MKKTSVVLSLLLILAMTPLINAQSDEGMFWNIQEKNNDMCSLKYVKGDGNSQMYFQNSAHDPFLLTN